MEKTAKEDEEGLEEQRMAAEIMRIRKKTEEEIASKEQMKTKFEAEVEEWKMKFQMIQNVAEQLKTDMEIKDAQMKQY